MLLTKKIIVLSLPIAVIASFVACGGDVPEPTPPATKLARIATAPLGSEVTGLYLTQNGDLFMNIQHPSDTLPAPENMAAVGVVEGIDFNNLATTLTSLALPSNLAEKQTMSIMTGGSYKVLGRSDDTYAGGLAFGLGAIVKDSGSAEIKQSQNPDFNAFLPTAPNGNSGYLFTAWEDRPGSMTRLKVNKNSGSWSVDNTDVSYMDFSGVFGTMINCFGTLSPWDTPLTSEENYEAENTENWNNSAYSNGYPNYADVLKIKDYLGGTFPNPYHYGYIVEITAPATASPVPVKHYTLGRMAHENAVIMPDKRTVYLTDDGTDKGFYKFVADTAEDLSAGTLYAAKVTQESGSDPVTTGFTISWIELAHRTNAQIITFINTFNSIDETDYVSGATSYITQAQIDNWAAGTGGDDAIAFVETLRAAKAKGATMEFRKMEGININYDALVSGDAPYMYVAMSEVRRGMADTEGDIQLTENRCGVVYRLTLDAGFNATRMDPVVAGGTYNGTASVNQCPTDAIANPDNVVVLKDGRVIIGEDTSKHENNMVWVYNPDA